MKQQHIGERVKALRLDREMTQAQMAVFLGVSVGTVVRLERGEKCYDVTRVKIEKRLGQAVAA
jgi:DNA-binding XRE family transcriptional regulator